MEIVATVAMGRNNTELFGVFRRVLSVVQINVALYSFLFVLNVYLCAII